MYCSKWAHTISGLRANISVGFSVYGLLEGIIVEGGLY